MNWKISLDRYLTEPPDDGFDNWVDKLLNHIPDDFYNENEAWFEDYDGQFNKWLNKLFYKKAKSPEQSARIIERAFKLYKQKSLSL